MYSVSLCLSVFILSFEIYSRAHACTPFINEIHYENNGADTGEAVEVAAPAGTDLTGYKIYYYNGANNDVYATATLSGAASDSGNGRGFIQITFSGIQNGSPDGMALVDDVATVLEFISYEGTITAVAGPAAGLTSIDIGVSESSCTAIGYSLQLSGFGCARDDFSWQSPRQNSFGIVNADQNFVDCNCGGGSAPTIPIYTVQGSGLRSPYEGQSVTVNGVVTGLASSSFYLQDINGDGDSSTSDAILVYYGSTSVSVQVGDYVSVTGTITEYIPSSSPDSQPVTELTFPSNVLISSGNSLPVPLVIGASGRMPPTYSIPSGIDFYESLEFMRVIAENLVMTGLKKSFGEYWTVLGSGAGATGFSSRNTIVISKSDFNPERV